MTDRDAKIQEVECVAALLAGTSSTLGVMLQIFELGQAILTSRYQFLGLSLVLFINCIRRYQPTPDPGDVVGHTSQMAQKYVIQHNIHF